MIYFDQGRRLVATLVAGLVVLTLLTLANAALPQEASVVDNAAIDQFEGDAVIAAETLQTVRSR